MAYFFVCFEQCEHADSGMSTAELAQKFYDKLYVSRGTDIEHGATSVGPHRDDIEVTLDSLPVASFGSQGQQRSCILSIKLGEAKLLGEAAAAP